MAEMGRKALVKSNLEYWLNNKLLTNGLYVTIPSGDVDIYGNDLSRLVSFYDGALPSGTVYQSAFKNWVYESGIIPTESGLAPPVVCSGVYVNGIFRAKDTTSPLYSAAYAHSIDYPNGRVIFDNVINATVQAEFSYKTVAVSHASEKNNENRALLIETARKDNPQASGADIYPSATSRTLPAVFIDIIDRRSSGYELGSSSLVSEFFGVFHIWSRDDFVQDLIEDILTDAQHSVILGINFNDAPYPLNYIGDTNGPFESYDTYANVHHRYFWRRMYLDEVRGRKDAPLFEVERGRAEFRVKVYPNF